VVLVLLVKVLPVFEDVYASLGGELTGVAGALLGLGKAIGAAMPVLFALLAALALFAAAMWLSPAFRGKVLAFWRGRHGDRGISRELSAARYVQALAMGLRSGLAADEAVTLAGELEKENTAATVRYQTVVTTLEEQNDLAEALAAGEIMNAAYLRMLKLAQRSGSTDAVMEEVARRMERSAEDSLEKLVSRVEPALVIVMSLLVGVILLSVMLPLMNIMSAIG
jgi:type IV pilus assembly protein PilC